MPRGFAPLAVISSQLTNGSVARGIGNPPAFKNRWLVLVTIVDAVSFTRKSDSSLGTGAERSTVVKGVSMPPSAVCLLRFTKVGEVSDMTRQESLGRAVILELHSYSKNLNGHVPNTAIAHTICHRRRP